MNFLDKIINYFAVTDNVIDISTGKFNKLNKAKISEILEIEERSIVKAKKNLPRPTSLKKDELARDIDESLIYILTTGKDYLRSKIEGLNQITSSQHSSINDNEKNKSFIRQNGEQALSNLYSNVKDFFNQIYEAKEKLIISKQSIKDFKINNGIDRNPIIPESRILNLGILSIMFLAEALINSLTLQDVHPGGLFGAIVEIFLFSIINIFLGFSVGLFFIRNIFRIEVIQKVYGLFFTLLFFIFGFIINISIGHYRDNLLKLTSINDYDQQMEQLSNIMSLVRNDFMSNILIYGDLKCYLITLAGLIFFFIASKKGFDWDDPYPEFGRYAKDEQTCLDEYSNSMKNAQDILKDISSKGVTAVSGSLVNINSTIEAINERKDHLKLLKSSFHDWCKRIEMLGNALYEQYREINLENRSDNKSPKCFEINFSLDKSLLTITDLDEDHDRSIENINLLKEYADNYQKKIESSLNDYLRVFKLVDDVEKLNTSSNYFDKIDDTHIKYTNNEN